MGADLDRYEHPALEHRVLTQRALVAAPGAVGSARECGLELRRDFAAARSAAAAARGDYFLFGGLRGFAGIGLDRGRWRRSFLENRRRGRTWSGQCRGRRLFVAELPIQKPAHGEQHQDDRADEGATAM